MLSASNRLAFALWNHFIWMEQYATLVDSEDV